MIVRLSRGSVRLIFLRLCSFAPRISICLPIGQNDAGLSQ